MKNFRLLFLAICASLMLMFSLFAEVHAGIVPGTLYEGAYMSSNSCNTTTNSYSPSGGSCVPRYCKVYEYAGACGNSVPDSMNAACGNSVPDSMSCACGNGSPDTMNCSPAPSYTSWDYACFVWGTQVTMADGQTKSIEDVKAGEMIRTYDEITKSYIDRPVEETFHHASKESTLFTFIYRDVKLTSNDVHLIYLPTEGRYLPASDIYAKWERGEKIALLDKDGELVQLEGMTREVKDVPLYNLHVVGTYDRGGDADTYLPNHNYIANGVVVHNEKSAESLDSLANYMYGACPAQMDVCTPNYGFGRRMDCWGTTVERDALNACLAGQSYTPPSGSSACGNAVPDSMSCSCGNAVPDSMNCSAGNAVPDSMNCLSGCTTYYQDPIMSGTLTFTNYLYNNQNPSYGMSGDARKLGQDAAQTCNRWADGTYHIAPTRTATLSCADGSDTYYVGGSNGMCNQFGSTDNLITYFNQVGAVTRSTPSDSDATCTVEGRYGTADDTGPTITVSNVTGVFDGDQDNWCNYAKYIAADYGTASNPELPGCKYYRDKAAHSSSIKNPDLLENMKVSVDDVSGISEIVIELGACTATYSLSTTASSIVVNTESASGVKPGFKDFNLNYNIQSTTADAGDPHPSLLNAFGRTRLDACLVEGKNYLRITAKDQARSDVDGVSYSPNTTVIDYNTSTKYIKIDNSGAKLKLTGNAAKVAESNAPAACYVGGITIDAPAASWKNFTIKGGVQSTDPFGNDAPECGAVCTTLKQTAKVCATSSTKGAKPSAPGVVWSAPLGVNPTTGAFTGYTCDSLGPIPDVTSCDWSCGAGLEYDPASNTCTQSSSLFILFAEGSPEALGSSAAKLSDDPTASRGLLKSKAGPLCGAPSPAGSQQYYDFKYQFGSNYTFASAPTGPFPIAENGLSICPPAPPVAPVFTYAWFGGAYSTCSASCGPGTQTRPVVCKRSDGLAVADGFCTAPKPAAVQGCNIATCAAETVPDTCHTFSCAASVYGAGYDIACWNQYKAKVLEWQTAGYMTQAAADDAIAQGDDAWDFTCQKADQARSRFSFSATRTIPTAGSPADLAQFDGRFTLDTEEYGMFGGCEVSASVCPPPAPPAADYVWHIQTAGTDVGGDSCVATVGQAASTIVEGNICPTQFAQRTCVESGIKYYVSCGTPLSIPAMCGSPNFPDSTCYQQGLCVAKWDIESIVTATGCGEGGTATGVVTSSCGGSTACSATWTCASPTGSSMGCGKTGQAAVTVKENGTCATPTNLENIGNTLDNMTCNGSTYLAVSQIVGNGGCTTGTISSSEAVCNPLKRSSWNWICLGSGGGTDSDICTAMPSAEPLGPCSLKWSELYVPADEDYILAELNPGESQTFKSNTKYGYVGTGLIRVGDTFTCPAPTANVCEAEAGVQFTDTFGNVCTGTSPETAAGGQSAIFCDASGKTGCATRTCQTDGTNGVWGGVSYVSGSCAPPVSPACRTGAKEWTNDACVGYPYGNAELQLIDVDGQGTYEWWQSTVDQDGGVVYSACSGRVVHSKPAATIDALPLCGATSACTWQKTGAFTVQSEPLRDEGQCSSPGATRTDMNGDIVSNCSCQQYYDAGGTLQYGQYHWMCESQTQTPPSGSGIPGESKDVYTAGTPGYWFGQACYGNDRNCDWQPGYMYFEHYQCTAGSEAERNVALYIAGTSHTPTVTGTSTFEVVKLDDVTEWSLKNNQTYIDEFAGHTLFDFNSPGATSDPVLGLLGAPFSVDCNGYGYSWCTLNIAVIHQPNTVSLGHYTCYSATVTDDANGKANFTPVQNPSPPNLGIGGEQWLYPTPIYPVLGSGVSLKNGFCIERFDNP